jgi:hypothetical protein
MGLKGKADVVRTVESLIERSVELEVFLRASLLKDSGPIFQGNQELQITLKPAETRVSS